MATFAAHEYFDVPPARAWEMLTDLRSAPLRVSGIERLEVLTDGPVGKGTRFRETRIMFKKEHTEEMEITAFDPPRAYTTECSSCGCHYRSTITCTPEGAGTRVEMSMTATPLTFSAKMMSVLLGWMMAGSCRKLFAKDLADLKRAAESAPAEAAQPA